jgi:hypothetical protein
VGWDGEGRERKGEERRDGKRAGGKYCFMAVGGMDATDIKEVSWSSVVDAELDSLSFGGICQNANAVMREMQICGMHSPAV